MTSKIDLCVATRLLSLEDKLDENLFDKINKINRVRQAKRDTTGEMKGVHSDKKSTVR